MRACDWDIAIASVQFVLGCILWALGVYTDGWLSFLYIVNGMLLVNISGPTVFVACVFGNKNAIPH
jgi:hypothetical protein